jgi:hypothetical protein
MGYHSRGYARMARRAAYSSHFIQGARGVPGTGMGGDYTP